MKSTTLLLAIAIIASVSCKKSSSPASPSTDLFAAYLPGADTATYWQNGTTTQNKAKITYGPDMMWFYFNDGTEINHYYVTFTKPSFPPDTSGLYPNQTTSMPFYLHTASSTDSAYGGTIGIQVYKTTSDSIYRTYHLHVYLMHATGNVTYIPGDYFDLIK